jgi:hypothetical protein
MTAVVKVCRATGRRETFGVGMSAARAALVVRLMGRVELGHFVTVVDEAVQVPERAA